MLNFINIEKFNKAYRNKRCFVVGNGPSLNEIDMSLLANEVTLGSNRSYIGYKKWGFDFTFWACQDEVLIEQCAQEFVDELPDDVIKFLPRPMLKYFNGVDGEMDNVVAMDFDYTLDPYPGFLVEGKVFTEGWTVTNALLQMSLYMGFEEVILVGVDHNYDMRKVEADHEKDFWTDKNSRFHFDPSYCNYEKGQKWNFPYFDKMNYCYDFAAKTLKEKGVKVYNATPGSKLRSFEFKNFNDFF